MAVCLHASVGSCFAFNRTFSVFESSYSHVYQGTAIALRLAGADAACLRYGPILGGRSAPVRVVASPISPAGNYCCNHGHDGQCSLLLLLAAQGRGECGQATSGFDVLVAVAQQSLSANAGYLLVRRLYGSKDRTDRNRILTRANAH